MKTTLTIIPNASKKKSVVKNGYPKSTKFVLNTSNLKSGFPFGNLIKGSTTNKTNKMVETIVR